MWKTLNNNNNNNTNCNWYSHQRIGTRTGGLGNNGIGGDCPNYSIAEISENTEKSPGILRRLAVTPTPMENHQLTVMWKTWGRNWWNYLQENLDTTTKGRSQSLLVAAENNNAIRTNFIKEKIDYTQQNSKCRLCGQKDEMANPTIKVSNKIERKGAKHRTQLGGKVDPLGIRDWNLTILPNGICTN